MPDDPPYPDPERARPLEPGCARCPALADARERISWGVGPDDAEVVVVGEAPGAGSPDADRWRGGNYTGLAYTAGHSGRTVRALFDALGVEPYVTNAVKCHPPGNRDPTPAERRACSGHLAAELDRVGPAAVVPTGKQPTLAVLDLAGGSLKTGFLDAVLDPRETPLGTVVPVLHPAYQHVWRPRLGFTRAEYRAAVADALRAAGVTALSP